MPGSSGSSMRSLSPGAQTMGRFQGRPPCRNCERRTFVARSFTKIEVNFLIVGNITHWALQIMFECGCGKTMPCTFELMGNGKRRKWGLYTAFQVAEELHFVGQRSFKMFIRDQ
ncbi:hypothetical protein GPALN_011588 [Globodera pallida]|nr:hypothetical protein GPALN_011588 [Globodera pallida]